MLERHAENLKDVKRILERRWKTAEKSGDDTLKSSVVEAMMKYRVIYSGDPRIGALQKREYIRDLRNTVFNRGTYIPECIYINIPGDIEMKATVNNRPGMRSYKETKWYVNYEALDVPMRIAEVSRVDSLKSFLKELKDIKERNGCEWEGMDSEEFGKLVGTGYYLIYRIEIKQIATTLYDTMGYIFIEVVNGALKYYKLIDSLKFTERFVTSQTTVNDCMEQLKKAVGRMNEAPLAGGAKHKIIQVDGFNDDGTLLVVKADSEEADAEPEEKPVKTSKSKKTKEVEKKAPAKETETGEDKDDDEYEDIDLEAASNAAYLMSLLGGTQ